MAKSNSTLTEQGNYQYKGETFPLATLTSDASILLLVGKLAKQGKAMDQAHLAGRDFSYKAIPIPKRLVQIFGG